MSDSATLIAGGIVTAPAPAGDQRTMVVLPTWLWTGSTDELPSWLALDPGGAEFAITESGLYLVTAQLVALSHVARASGDDPANFTVHLTLELEESGGGTT